jgi:hypothetical protein
LGLFSLISTFCTSADGLKYSSFLALDKHNYFIKSLLASLKTFTISEDQSWASASRLMLLASVFRHQSSQSGTEAFWYRIGSPYSGTGMVPAWEFFSFRYRTDYMPISSALRRFKIV